MSKKTVTIAASGEQGAGKTLLIGLLKHALWSHGIETRQSGPHGLTVDLDERDREVLALANRKAGQ